MIQDFIVDGQPRLAVFDTSTPYYQFVVKMKQITPETDVDSWMRDSKAQFAFNQGYEAGRLLDKDRTVYMENRLQIEEEKRKKLVELLRENGVIVDATGDKIRIDSIVDKYGKETHFIARWI